MLAVMVTTVPNPAVYASSGSVTHTLGDVPAGIFGRVSSRSAPWANQGAVGREVKRLGGGVKVSAKRASGADRVGYGHTFDSNQDSL